MSERQRSIDPRFEPGPASPTDVLRPLVSEQRILLLDGPNPMMVDLATGDIRGWENGPPLSIPSVSLPFALADYETILVQVQRDPRPTTTDLVLLSIEAGDAVVDVVERSDGVLQVRHEGRSVHGPIGDSMAIVISLHPTTGRDLVIKVRNAETTDGFELPVELGSLTATLTIGGPSAQNSGSFGRRRLIPAFVDVQPRKSDVGQRQRAASLAKKGAKRLSREAKDRIGR